MYKWSILKGFTFQRLATKFDHWPFMMLGWQLTDGVRPTRSANSTLLDTKPLVTQLLATWIHYSQPRPTSILGTVWSWLIHGSQILNYLLHDNCISPIYRLNLHLGHSVNIPGSGTKLFYCPYFFPNLYRIVIEIVKLITVGHWQECLLELVIAMAVWSYQVYGLL